MWARVGRGDRARFSNAQRFLRALTRFKINLGFKGAGLFLWTLSYVVRPSFALCASVFHPGVFWALPPPRRYAGVRSSLGPSGIVPRGDITHLKTGEGWQYLASFVDLSTRTVVGWSFSTRMTADICASALEVVKRCGYVAGGAVFHSGLAVHRRGARGVVRRRRREAPRGCV